MAGNEEVKKSDLKEAGKVVLGNNLNVDLYLNVAGSDKVNATRSVKIPAKGFAAVDRADANLLLKLSVVKAHVDAGNISIDGKRKEPALQDVVSSPEMPENLKPIFDETGVVQSSRNDREARVDYNLAAVPAEA
jgi:hypothetical protein